MDPFCCLSSRDYNSANGDRLMIVDWVISLMHLTLIGLLSFFPDGSFVKLPDGLNNFFRGAARWIDMDTAGTVMSLIIAIYAAYGLAMLANWVMKRIRGG